MRFVDLFAGLGGFHLALRTLGHECVFACEIDKHLQECYEKNFGIRPAGDIREIDARDVPPHEILCAGFPCQPFSKAGSQFGLNDPDRGDLFMHILRLIRHHKPPFLLLENVPHLLRHDHGRTWASMKALLEEEGYEVRAAVLSPHEFGIPQIRKRAYIVGSSYGLKNFRWPAAKEWPLSIRSILDVNPVDARPLPAHVKQCLDVWQEFLDMVPAGERIPSPLWSMEFGATYPYTECPPSSLSLDELRRYRGAYGVPLNQAETMEGVLELLPPYARSRGAKFPNWKLRFIERSRRFYVRHKRWLEQWVPKIQGFPPSYQKLEWNCQERDPRTEDRRLRNYLIQLRPSGVRVKRPTTAPSLVAMTASQVPIIPWEARFITPTECKRLQSMDALQHLPTSPNKAYQALGNAVNVEVARMVATCLLPSSERHSPGLSVSTVMSGGN